MSKSENPKWAYYAGVLSNAIAESIENDIDAEELMTGDNLTHFIHALTNAMPTLLFNKLTGEDKNHLELNHIANTLCFQYSIKKK